MAPDKRKRRLRSPIQRRGGKGNMVGRLLRLVPSHQQYCEPFFGGGSLFFAKAPAPHETINDIDEAVTTFFRVLRDHGEEFIQLAALTEYSEALWRECRARWREETDPVRKAWRWWVVARMSFAANWGAAWGHTRTQTAGAMPKGVASLLSCVESLPQVVARLQGVQISCTDWQRAVMRTDTPDCLHYLDPPYLPSTRIQPKVYTYEMSEEDHVRLIDFLLSGEVKGKVLLSGYANPLYARLEEAGWARVDFRTACHAAGRTVGTGILGKGAATAMQPRIESVWLDPRTAKELGIQSGKLFGHSEL